MLSSKNMYHPTAEKNEVLVLTVDFYRIRKCDESREEYFKKKNLNKNFLKIQFYF